MINLSYVASRRAVGQRVDRVELIDEPLQLGVIQGHEKPGDIDLGEFESMGPSLRKSAASSEDR